jgi:biopolymer transport protein ExbD
MADIIESGGGREKGGKRRPKKHSTNIDMTPMVDLMCLLITFFMLTTAFAKPKVMEITMPEPPKENEKKDQPQISADRTINIILSGDDKLYYYDGVIETGKPIPVIKKSSYGSDGIRKYLLERNKLVFEQIVDLREKVTKGELVMADSTLNNKIKEIKKSDKKSPIILIKADEFAKYRNIVDIIDEMAITSIASYAVVDINDAELKLLATAPK